MSQFLYKRRLLMPTKLIVKGHHIERCELENKKPPLIELRRIPFQNELLKFNSSLINSYQKIQEDISKITIIKNSSFVNNKKENKNEMKNALIDFLNEKINRKYKTPRNKKLTIKIFDADDFTLRDNSNNYNNNINKTNYNYTNQMRNRFYQNHKIILPLKNKKIKIAKDLIKTEGNFTNNNLKKSKFNFYKNIEKINIHYDNEIENNFQIRSITNKK